jgi:hypothetical protein
MGTYVDFGIPGFLLRLLSRRICKFSSIQWSELLELNLELNQIKYVHADAFKSCIRLSTLNLLGNQIRTLDPDMFENISNLRKAKFASNQIAYIGSYTFQDPSGLEMLDLMNNSIIYIHIVRCICTTKKYKQSLFVRQSDQRLSAQLEWPDKTRQVYNF